jgi:DNA polymerase-1
MIVSRQNIDQVIEHLHGKTLLALDTETTGLMPFHGDCLFSLIIADEKEEYYFNFQSYPELSEEFILPRASLEKLRDLFSSDRRSWILHNAKFDMHVIAREGLRIAGPVLCTQSLARLEFNNHIAYSLDQCAARIGLKKDDAVKLWISKNRAYSWECPPGKKKRIQKPRYNQVPWEIISKYGCTDARVTYQLGMKLTDDIVLKDMGLPPGVPKLQCVVENEIKLTKTIFEMEQRGVLVDLDYCARAAQYEENLVSQAEADFKAYTGRDFTDSGKLFSEVFEAYGLAYALTEKGNPSFDDEALAGVDHPLAGIIRSHRTHSKNAGTYYRSFAYYADAVGVIHPNFRQGGTATGRFSMSDPNLQNVPKESDPNALYTVRHCFKPRPGFVLVMIDYDQMEYRMMVDYAREEALITQIKAGLDVHQAVLNTVGCKDRDMAKMVNFGILYGAGISKIALMLGVSENEARNIKNNYFRQLPNVSAFISQVVSKAKYRGWLFNWLGRRYDFSDPNFAYKAPNALIQGGCADVVKVAMNEIRDFLLPFKSRMVLQIHDEIILEVHESELRLVPEIKSLMEKAYPAKLLPLTCSVSHSWKSWGDKQKGMPSAEAERDLF